MAQRILRVVKNTFFKLRPEQIERLAENERAGVTAGATYEIHSYAYADENGDFNRHIKFALSGRSINGFNTWFVDGDHIQVEFDGVVVYPHEDQETSPVLWINQNTVLKTRPVQSSILPPEQLFQVSQGQRFVLHSYAFADAQGDFDDHIRFAIRDRKDFVRGLSTWYVYERHAFVEYDGDVVYPPEPVDVPTLRITQDTVLKRRPVQSSSLTPEEVAPVRLGTELTLLSYAYADQSGSFNNHIKISLRYVKDYIRNMNTWYVYDRHAVIVRNGAIVYPIVSPSPSPSPSPAPGFSGIPFKLPGNTSTFYTDQPIIPGGRFTWGEATRNASRIPEDQAIVDNIIGLARELEKARNQIGQPFRITSWYRPPRVNSQVGGASRSQHLFGRAVDVEVVGWSGRRAANAVLSWWPGGIGIYSHLPHIIHLDTGSRRYWGF